MANPKFYWDGGDWFVKFTSYQHYNVHNFKKDYNYIYSVIRKALSLEKTHFERDNICVINSHRYLCLKVLFILLTYLYNRCISSRSERYSI